jgi:hypothetical protein
MHRNEKAAEIIISAVVLVFIIFLIIADVILVFLVY